MLRFLFRVVVIALVLGAVAFYFGYRWDGTTHRVERASGTGAGAAAGAIGGMMDRERVREAGAEIADTIAESAGHAEAALGEARLTAKIKSKMLLDDTIAAGRLNVDTQGTVVTVGGSVDTPAQHERALQLARETDGVTSVVDRIAVNRR